MNKGQKLSITLLLASKTFERLAFYLIMAILVRYLMDSLNIETDEAGIYYSLFYGTIVIIGVFSGLLGDLHDRVKLVKLGFILLTAMYLAIIFLPGLSIVIIIALILLGVGVGLVTPNIIVFLGNIYNEKENEIIGLSGFILFSIIINIGAFIALPFSIFLKNTWGYNSVFLFAFIFVFLSLLLFLKFSIVYNKLNLIAEQKEYQINASTKKLNTIILISILAIGFILRFALYQRAMTFTMAIRDYLEDGLSLTQTLNDIEKYISIILLVLFAFIVARIKQLNWGKIFNFIIIGLLFAVVAFVLIANFSTVSQFVNGTKLFIQSYFFIVIAETLVSPVIFYIIYRSSPTKYKGLFQGISYVVVASANILLFLSTLLYEKNKSLTFVIFTIILLISAILILILKKFVNNKIAKMERDKEMGRY